MQYGKTDWGEFLNITQENGGKLYTFLFKTIYNKIDTKNTMARFIEFLAATKLFNLHKNTIVRFTQIFTQDNYLPTFILFHLNEDKIGPIDNDAIQDIVEKINETSNITEIDADHFYNTFIIYINVFKDSNIELESTVMNGDIPDSLPIRKTEEMTGKRIRKEEVQHIYKIRCRDMLNLKDYAEYFFIQNGNYYIKALPGVMLDEFYDRADIIETSKKRILTDQFIH